MSQEPGCKYSDSLETAPLPLRILGGYWRIREHSVAAKSGGCFPGEALVTVEAGGQRPIRDLRPGDRVLASSGSDGAGCLVYSEVLSFLDRQPDARKLFYTIDTASGARLSLTAAHLLFVSEGNCSEGAAPTGGATVAVYAGHARRGQCVLVAHGDGGRFSRITRLSARERRGAYAPLTAHGTVVVDGVVASCYAAVDRHDLAHWAFAPLRLVHGWTGFAGNQEQGLHWYSRLLHWLGRMVLDSEHFHPLGSAQPGS